MFPIYAAGYYSARLGLSRWCNPWHAVVLAEQRRAWDAGHCDACIDLRGPASVCRLEPECVRS
jgi:hypothetical protein